jgi:hypothetical protein
MILEKIKNSFLYYDENIIFFIKDYINYIKLIIQGILFYTDLNVNIILGFHEYDFKNTNKTIKICYNIEHTLVKQNGRDTNNAIIGNINVNEDEKYLVRLENLNLIKEFNIMIDYSIPNIINIKNSELYKNLQVKLIYISPLLYSLYININNRNINSLTTFINTNEPRRFKLLENLQNNNFTHININNCFNKDELYNLYKNTKILINIHQTDHHHTFEELRVLPALLSGVIVICEDSPLKESIPYSKFLIWCKYDEIITKLQDIQNNYEFYYNKIFGNNELEQLYNIMEKNNFIDLQKIIITQ